jgi:hypothetical protein
MSAAALLATTAVATADESKKSHSGSASISLSGFCDGAKLNWKGDLYVGQHTVVNCGTSAPSPIELAYSGKTKNKAGAVAFYVPEADSSSSFNIVLSTPIKSGGTFTIFDCLDLTSCFEIASGNYTVNNGARHNSGSPSIASKLAQMLKGSHGMNAK